MSHVLYWSQVVQDHSFPSGDAEKITIVFPKIFEVTVDNVDGQNPAPPGMVKTL